LWVRQCPTAAIVGSGVRVRFRDVEGDEAAPDLVGLRHAEVGVEGQSVQVVLASEGRVAECVVGVAETGMGAGLLRVGADVGGDRVGGGVVGAGISRTAGCVGGLAESVERAGFALPVAVSRNMVTACW
jgi:hypothetical protein